jgi:hypothetical protein
MSPTASWMTCSRPRPVGIFASAPLIARATLHVGLEDELQLLGLALLDLREHLVERRGLLGARAPARSRAFAATSAFAVFSSGTARNTSPASGRWQAEDLDRPRRLGAADGLPLSSVIASDAAEMTGDDQVAALERAGLDEDRRDGSALGVEVRLDDAADRGRSGSP